MLSGNAATKLKQSGFYIAGTTASVFLALAITAVFLAVVGRDPVATYQGICAGAFGDSFSLSETIVTATPILLCALSVAVAGWVGLMNVGGEGQLYMGAIGATYVAINFPTLPGPELLTLMAASACVCGGLWCAIPGFLRVFFGVSEVIVSLLMNYVALLFVEFLIHGPWQDPTNLSWPQTIAFPGGAELPHLFNTRVHLGFVFGVVLSLAFAVLLPVTKVGFVARAIGKNVDAAEYAHYRVAKYQIIAMILSGAVAALAGFGQVSAIEGRLRSGLSPGYGYTGLLVAWLARHNPVAIVIISVLIAGLLSGADSLQLTSKLPFATVNILQGIIFFCVVGSEHFINAQSRKSFAGARQGASQ